MRRLPLIFFFILTAASLMGLGLAWLMNVSLFGRPHAALLQLVAENAAAGIDCQNPKLSPLFRGIQIPAPSTLHYVLLDAQGHVLGQRGHIPKDLQAAWAAQPREAWRADNPLRRDSVWVEVPGLCAQNWSLWAWDPRNETYRGLLLPRQIILVASCSGAIIFVVGLAWLFLRRKGREAQHVLTQIREGIFGSRLPTRFWEPRLALVTEFNRIAAAVEDSFARLREMEARRARLLSELAHDVRTPLASLRAAAETLSEFHQQLSEEQKQNLQQTLMLDLVYFQKLIDDLLVLAQMDRLDTLPPQHPCDLRPILVSAWSRMREIHPQLQTSCALPGGQPQNILVPGDESLLRRLLQNTLDNAFHAAQTHVRCEVLGEDGRWILRISNDALPLQEEDLQNWGHKRRQRIITEKAGQPHTSLGLGSSIIVGVSRHLGGSARIEQTHTPGIAFPQVTVTIELPAWKAPL